MGTQKIFVTKIKEEKTSFCHVIRNF